MEKLFTIVLIMVRNDVFKKKIILIAQFHTCLSCCVFSPLSPCDATCTLCLSVITQEIVQRVSARLYCF